MECEDDEDSDLEIVLEGKIVHDSLPDKERRTTVQLERVVDHRINHHCEDHFIAGKDSKTYYTSLNKQRENEKAVKRAKEKEKEKEKENENKKGGSKPSIFEQLKAKKREEDLENHRKKVQATQQELSSSSSSLSSACSSSVYGEMVGSVRVPPPCDIFRINALARAKELEQQRQKQQEQQGRRSKLSHLTLIFTFVLCI